MRNCTRASLLSPPSPILCAALLLCLCLEGSLRAPFACVGLCGGVGCLCLEFMVLLLCGLEISIIVAMVSLHPTFCRNMRISFAPRFE